MRRPSPEVARASRILLFSACLSLAALAASQSLPSAHSAGPSGGARPAAGAGGAQGAGTRARLSETFGTLPLRFEENRGQTSPEVLFLSRGSGHTLFLTRAGAVLRLLSPAGGEEAAPPLADTLRFELPGSNRSPAVVGLDEFAFRSNYLVGRDAGAWRTGVANFAKVRYESVYPGIDLVYYGRDGRLEYDFLVAPGARPGRIRLRFEGARRTRIDAGGDLVISTGADEVRQQKPVAYQEAGGARKEVAVRYAIDRRGDVRLALGDYDRTRPLVIDPVLIYSSYLGGSGADQALGLAVDASGSAYVCGSTASTDFPAPTAGAFQGSKSGFADAFVLKLSPDGRSLAYATYLGGDGHDTANSVAVDAAGNAYVAGLTGSLTFPVVAGSFQQSKDGLGDAFVAKLNPAGSNLVYSTYLGGNGVDQIFSVAVDGAGAAHVAGRTESFNFTGFPAAVRAGSPVQKSTDAAATWGASSAGLTASAVNDFAVSPSEPNVVYAGTNAGVYKSTDAGSSWHLTGTASPSTAPPAAREVAVDPSNPNVVYAVLNGGGGVYKSTDGGALYEVKSSGIGTPVVRAIAVNPSTPTTLYAGTSFGIFKSTDGANNWTQLRGSTVSSVSVNTFAIDPANPQTVYAATNRGVLKTTDGGATWALSNALAGGGTLPPPVNTLTIDPANPSTLYAGITFPSGPGVYKSTNGGASWVSAANGLTITSGGQSFTPSISVLLADPSTPATVYAGTSAGVFKSSDGGANWAAINAGLTNLGIVALGARPGAMTTLLAGANVGGDAFAAKFNPAGSQVEYLRLLGGSESDEARGIAVGPGGSAYVVGTAWSPNFPTANPLQPAIGGFSDAFVARLGPTGATAYATYLGGSASDTGMAVAVGPGGEPHVTGITFSTDFPLANALQPHPGDPSGFADAYVTKLAADGQSLAYSTYFGGVGFEQGTGIAVGADGSAYITGQTDSFDFPMVDPAGPRGNFADAFAAKLNPAGSALIFSTPFGGSNTELGNAVAADAKGNVYVVGNTNSTDLPVANSLSGAAGGGGDGFIAKFGVEADLSLTMTESRDPVMVGNPLSYTLRVTNAGPSPATSVTLTDTLPAGLAFVSAVPTEGTCRASGQVVTCTLSSLAASGSVTVVINVNPTAAGNVTNNAQVVAAETDSNPSNNSASETTKISASPSIKGRVTTPGGAGLSGVTVTLSGAQSAATQTDADGFYQFAELPAGGTYVVTPSKENFSLDPPSRTFDNLGADQTANFTATACTWTLSPAVGSIGSGGGSATVTVNTLHGCPWTAASGSDWITITSPAAGTGTGTVSFTVAPTGAPRVGRLTVAGRNFPVYQEFNSCGTPDFSLSSYNLSSSPTVVRAADLNGDGRPDLVAANGGGLSGGGIQGSVLLNDGAGRFNASSFDLGLGAPQGFDLGDFNGDGRPDVAMTDYNSSFVRLFFNNGSGGFGQSAANAPFTTQGQSPLTRGVKSADVNRDGKPDLLVSTPGTNGLQVLLGTGAGTFTQAAPVNGSAVDVLIGVADVNADGSPDLIYGGGGSGSRQLAVRLGDGTGAFGALIVSAGPSVSGYAGVGDFDGDGRLDIAASTIIPAPSSTPSNPFFTNGVTIFSGDGAGHFTPRSSVESGGMANVVVADFNNDAKPDVAYATGAPKVTVRLGDGAGGLRAPLEKSTGGSGALPGVFGLTAADFDGDSRPDLAGADYSNGAVVLKNNCAGAPFIAGRITSGGAGLSGVTVTLSGAQSASTQTDAGGNYFIGGLTAGASYVVTPSKENFRFSPASVEVNGLVGGRTADFTATAMTVRLARLHNLVDEHLVNSLVVEVLRAGDTSGPATVNYSTGGTTLSAPASDRSDYTYAAGTLRFAPGETTKSFTVLLNDDGLPEGWEAFTVNLSDPTGAILAFPSTALVEIRDNEFSQAAANPVDGSQFFVRQHYHDFLNREPDADGLAFWTNEIEQCGANQQCREVRRINVSAAFFLSIEFQETGYFVYRVYKSAYGDATSPNVAGTVPIIRLLEFLPDTRRAGDGVVVGRGEWRAQLEANKGAFALEFVQRRRFLDAFPRTLTAAQFVDRLRENTGAALSAHERDQLVSELEADNTDAGRASVLRKVADDADLRSAEQGRAFVLMQYFGYMRRNPDDPQDTDFRGWKFWLDKLNQFGGNYVEAEMVKAFITSDEYRRRFGR